MADKACVTALPPLSPPNPPQMFAFGGDYETPGAHVAVTSSASQLLPEARRAIAAAVVETLKPVGCRCAWSRVPIFVLRFEMHGWETVWCSAPFVVSVVGGVVAA